MRAALVIPLLPFLAACDWMDAAEGRSPGKDYIERLSALEAGMAKITPITPPKPSTVAAITTPKIEPKPVAVKATEPVKISCSETFRVNRCSPSGETLPW